MPGLRIEAPAKINLGLEVLGKRSDGFHEIRTVLAMIDLTDTLETSEIMRVDTIEGVPPDQNLVTRAFDLFARETGTDPCSNWSLTKRIPIAAGLGGASSDAAAALLLARSRSGLDLDGCELAKMAASLGSDVPFFLGSPVALASGRGTSLENLQPVGWPILVMTPAISIPNKTGTMYRALESRDFGSGSGAERVLRCLQSPELLTTEPLWNSFLNPLRRQYPILESLIALLEASEAPWGLSGAGPSFYAIIDGVQRDTLAGAVQKYLPLPVVTFKTSTRTHPLVVSTDVQSN